MINDINEATSIAYSKIKLVLYWDNTGSYINSVNKLNKFITDITVNINNNSIEIISTRNIQPVLYLINKNGFIAISNDIKYLADKARENSINLVLNTDRFLEYINNHVQYVSKLTLHRGSTNCNIIPYLDITPISCYNKITISNNNINISYLEDTIHTIELEDADQILIDWISKYKSIISRYQQNLIPELTAGTDSRILTYFWRYLDIKVVRNKIIKTDTNNMYDGLIGRKLLKLLGEYNIIEEITDKNVIVLSGIGTEPLKEPQPNGFFYNFINAYCQYFYKPNSIYPFLDDNFLKIKVDKKYLLIAILLKLLANDLLELPFHSYSDEPPYHLDKMIIMEAEDYIARKKLYDKLKRC